MKLNNITKFFSEHSIIRHALFILVTAFVLASAALYATDIFTEHGKTKEVPDIKNLPLHEAIARLESEGFNWEITDSVFNEISAPGVVVSQNPKGGSSVKSQRLIFITINAFNPRTVRLPSVVGVSMRQGQSMLESLGFRNIQIITAPSPYSGLILSLTANGKMVEPGTKLPLTAHILLSVGSGYDENPNDSISSDAVGESEIVEENAYEF